MARSTKSSRKRILLTGVFGPFGVDDAYGRKENIMELFHNQVTKAQGLASFRFHHRSFGLYFIAANLDADVTVLGGTLGQPELVVGPNGEIIRLNNITVVDDVGDNPLTSALSVGSPNITDGDYFVAVANDGYADIWFRTEDVTDNEFANGSSTRWPPAAARGCRWRAGASP